MPKLEDDEADVAEELDELLELEVELLDEEELEEVELEAEELAEVVDAEVAEVDVEVEVELDALEVLVLLEGLEVDELELVLEEALSRFCSGSSTKCSEQS